MLQDVISEDSSTWEAIAFVRKFKKIMPNFDFKIYLDDNLRPNMIIYDTSDT